MTRSLVRRCLTRRMGNVLRWFARNDERRSGYLESRVHIFAIPQVRDLHENIPSITKIQEGWKKVAYCHLVSCQRPSFVGSQERELKLSSC